MRTGIGQYFDGRKPQGIPAQITITPDGFHIVLPEKSFFWPYSEIDQTQGHYENEPIRFEHGKNPTEIVIISDPEFLEALHELVPQGIGHFHHPKYSKRRHFVVGGALLATVALITSLYFWGVPLAASWVAKKIPISWEEKLGENVLTSLFDEEDFCYDVFVNQAISEIVERLSPHIFKIRVVKAKSVNALAAPGGNIIIFSGLLEKTTSPEMLAGVIAHEMEHVIQRHGLEGLLRDIALSTLLSALLGDTTGVSAAILEGAKTFGELDYSRSQESEADREGVILLIRADIDPHGMVDFFKMLQKEESADLERSFQYFSTHPVTEDRIHDLTKAIAKTKKKYRPLPYRKNWMTLIKGC